MSLVTVLRSPSTGNTSVCTDSEREDEVDEGSPRSRSSSFEGFFTSKGSAFALPDGDFARKASKHGGEMQMHLQSMVNLLRDDDILRLVVKLEGAHEDRVRYLTVVSAFNEDDIEESIAMGIDWVNKRATCTIGLVLPLMRDTKIELDGDGGFKISTNYRRHILKPVSVQTMWTAVQWIHRCAENARKNNHFPNGLSHKWCSFYSSHLSSDQQCINEWDEMEDISSKRIEIPTGTTPEQELMMKLIRHKLKEVMMKVDLEEVTSRMIRQNLEDEMQMELKEYKTYIDEAMLIILGQLDSASKIYDHVYLGSEWNASNLEELRENGIGYIVNISREIDNFFYGTFEYLNVRVYDTEDADLLPHWNKTHKFINKAKERGAKVLVHCKMGISRSASTVIAYGMKEYGTSLNDTLKYVKAKRSVVNPNSGFWKQLITYEGILNSSKQRYNALFTGSRRRTNSADDLNTRQGGKRRRNRRNQKSKTVTIGEKLYPQSVLEEARASTLERGMVMEGQGDDPFQGPYINQSSPVESSSSAEEVLRTWENSLSENTERSPSNSRSSSPERDTDEVEDTVGLLEQSKGKVTKESSLHRARSVPLLPIGETSTSPDERCVDADSSRDELHRCSSLHEFLSGKVQKLKEDFKVHTKDRHSGSVGMLERKSISNPTSPVGELNQDDTDDKVVKTRLHSTLSDPTHITTDRSFNSDIAKETVVEQTDKEDVGSVEDQSHSVVHRDAQGVVKSGTVKRQSRNFEEGRVNLPWEWEVALDVLEKSENAAAQETSPHAENTEEPPTAEDEPPIGVVKMHAQKFQGKSEGDGKDGGSEQDITNIDQGLDKDEKTLVADAGSLDKEGLETQGERTKDDEQRPWKLLDKEVQRVNEDMIQEKAIRRTSGKRRSGLNADETINPTTSEIHESECVPREDVSEENSPSEDPLPGIVKKHTQAIEWKYQKTAACSGDNSEDIKDKKMEPVNVTEPVSTSYRFQSSVEVEDGVAEASTVESLCTDDSDGFDVDALLRRVNEDMQREREQRLLEEGFGKGHGGCSFEESMFVDVQPQSENTDPLHEQADESEIPRPGTVKRNTELLLGKGKVSQETSDKNASAGKEEEQMVIPTEFLYERNDEQANVLSRDEVQTEQKTDETVKSNPDSPSGKGVVKRHTLVYEGVLPFPLDDVTPQATMSEAVESEVKRSTSEEDSKTADLTSSGESSSGTVKRNTLIFEGKVSQDDTEALKSVDSSLDENILDNSQQLCASKQEDEPKTQDGAEQDAVDTSSVVSVKLRLQLLEEVICAANVRENCKQRTTKALADLEDKRKRIEMEQKKLDQENISPEHIVVCPNEADDHPSEPEVLPTTASSQERTEELETQAELESLAQEKPENGDAPCVGNVRLRTLLLEERIQGDKSTAKPGTSLRRHGSMPRTTRPVRRPAVRQRSMSDLEVRTQPSSSVASCSPLVYDTDKTRGSHTMDTQMDDMIPDNDRNSEKLIDDSSEMTVKTDDVTTKSSKVIEVEDRNIEFSNSKESTNKDNKDIQTLS